MKKILFKRSTVEGKVPLPAEISMGELALNLADRKIYSKDAEGNIVQMGGGSGEGTAPTAISDITGLTEALGVKRDFDDNNFNNYTITSTDTTDVIDLSAASLFRVDSSVVRTLTFANVPASDKSTTVIVHLHSIGTSIVHTWPEDINWSSETPPILEGAWMNIVLLWTGSEWTGSVGSSEVTRIDMGLLG